jgi:hypothetical protein
MSFNLKLPAFILGAALVCGSVTVVDAQTGAPAGGGAAGAASGLNNPSVGMGTRENNSGGTAPGPVYSGPAAQSGANSPPVNSGITDPKTGANNDTVPLKESGRANPPNPGASGD